MKIGCRGCTGCPVGWGPLFLLLLLLLLCPWDDNDDDVELSDGDVDDDVDVDEGLAALLFHLLLDFFSFLFLSRSSTLSSSALL